MHVRTHTSTGNQSLQGFGDQQAYSVTVPASVNTCVDNGETLGWGRGQEQDFGMSLSPHNDSLTFPRAGWTRRQQRCGGPPEK